jgi:hypothetical protein
MALRRFSDRITVDGEHETRAAETSKHSVMLKEITREQAFHAQWYDGDR